MPALFAFLQTMFSEIVKFAIMKRNVVIDKVIEQLVQLAWAAVSWIFSDYPTASRVEPEIEKLRKRADWIQSRLVGADETWRIEDKLVLNWLTQLRAIAFDMDDLLDEYEIKSNSNPPPRFWYYSSVMNRIKDINTRYDDIKKEREANRIHLSEGTRVRRVFREPVPAEVGSMSGTSRIHGRSEKKNELFELLRPTPDGAHNNLKVIPIVGEGGIGKTALAQAIYNDTRIAGNFSSRIWISLSPSLDALKTIKKIIECETGSTCSLSTLDSLQHKLHQLLTGKKFLLVLDSLWTEDPRFWDDLRIPLLEGQGSTVLVTTRSQVAAQYMDSSNSISLTGLDPSFCWLILKDKAFSTDNSQDELKKLEPIGKEIANKCHGSPLVAKLLGKTLHNITDEAQWKGLLDDMPGPDEIINNILPLLRPSYDSLPLHLKNCFAYCAIFPKGYEFDREDLVKLWVAEGLVMMKRTGDQKRLEKLGRKQFDNLLFRSFFQLSDSNNNKYIIPGLVHDLAESVSEYECLRVDQSGIQNNQCKETRYALFCPYQSSPGSLNKIYNNKCLRTFIVYNEFALPVTNVQPKVLFNKLKCLRSLDMSNCKLENLPESIGTLIHLRYLNLRGSLFEKLPEGVCKLSKLQTLELGYCYKLKELPNGITNLVDLRHIGLNLDWENWDGTDLNSMPQGIGNLTFLKTLSRFVVGENTDGRGISEIKNFDLTGELCISKLENVADSNEASEASLSTKKNLEFIMFKWSERENFNMGNEEGVLRNLQPANEIKSIWIECYNGSNFPNWISHQVFKYLETIKLSKCRYCADLPQIGNLPQLKKLYIEGMNEVKDLNKLISRNSDSAIFPSLEKFHILDMHNLDTWFDISSGELTNLSELVVSRCPELKTLTYLPMNLKKFELRNCSKLTSLPFVPSLSDLIIEGTNWRVIGWSQNLISLSSLTILKVPGLKHITKNNLSRPSGLKTLKIEGCCDLQSLARNGGLANLSSLKELEISSCPRLESFFDEGLPASIEELKLQFLDSIESLPNGLGQLSFLHTLEIHTVPLLKSLPGLPSSLQNLFINGCPELEKRCKMNGPDWANIRHVTSIRFGAKSLSQLI